jgi:D-amino peptidase
MVRILSFCLLFSLSLFSSAMAQASKLKVYISVDMEGVVGTVTDDQLGPGGFEYQRFREFMTREALAAVHAAKEAGATEIVVGDSHGNGENLLIELFPKDVRIIRSWPRRLGMVGGIDGTFDALIFIGYHSSTSNPKGVRAHTFSSGRLTRVALNGIDVTEAAWNAAIAGHFGVPVVMISGDDAVIEEARKLLGPIEAAEVKKSLGFHSASTLTPDASYELIAQKVKAGLARRKEFKAYVLKSPITLDVSFKHYRVAEVLEYLKGVERTDAHSVRFAGKDMVEISNFMVFLTHYSLTLEP